jgi:bifunctional non-homologous end joining protein LigD
MPPRTKPGLPAALPDFIAPELATLTDKAPTGDGWLHEIKLDGYRTAARLEAGKVRMLTRSGLDWTARFRGRIRVRPSLALSWKVPTNPGTKDGQN